MVAINVLLTVQDFGVQSNKILGEKDLHRDDPMTHRDQLVVKKVGVKGP